MRQQPPATDWHTAGGLMKLSQTLRSLILLSVWGFCWRLNYYDFPKIILMLTSDSSLDMTRIKHFFFLVSKCLCFCSLNWRLVVCCLCVGTGVMDHRGHDLVHTSVLRSRCGCDSEVRVQKSEGHWFESPRIAAAEQVGTSHGSLCHQGMNVHVWMWKVSFLRSADWKSI